MDDATLTKIIDDSPLTPEDKVHWKTILPKLDEEHRRRLNHTLVAKTEVVAAIVEIKKTLAIIEEAEKEAKAEMAEEATESADTPAVTAPLQDTTTPIAPNPVEEVTPEKLMQIKQESEAQLAKLREEMKQLSISAHGTTPPSYATN